jgi:excinuclease ABC subunit A
VLDIGPGAGVHGGKIVAQGTPADIEKHPDSLTGKYLSGRVKIALPGLRTPRDPKRVIKVFGATGNNLKDVDAEFPLGLFTCVTGVSGSGKSTLVNDTLFTHANHKLNGTVMDMAPCREIKGLEEIDRIIDIDQSPIGRTPRSNPATYTGLFGPLRELFAEVPESRTRGYDAGRFSFNVKGGRCEACQGDGLIKVEMHFLPDVYVPCDVCQGKRYNRETLDIRWRGKNIHEVLDMNVEDAPVPERARRGIKAADPHGRGPVLSATRPERDHSVWWRSPARQTRPGTRQAGHRAHSIYIGRAHHRAALP